MLEKLPVVKPYKIGEDVEFFAVKKETGAPLPAWKWFKRGEKAKKIQLSGYNNSGHPGKVFRDGLAVEVNISPATCRAWLWEDVKALLKASVPKTQQEVLTFTTKPYIEFGDEFKKGFPKDLQVLGCNPTLDAYTERQKHVEVDPMKINFRTSGSHLHMSFGTSETAYGSFGNRLKPLPQECWAPIIKLSDLLIGLPFTYIFGDEDEFQRRRLYGQAGEFRFQESYGGIEYRVLSSRLFNHPGTFSLFTGIWKYIIPHYPIMWEAWDKAWESELQEAINEGRGVEKLLPLWDKVVGRIDSKFCYTLGGPDVGRDFVPVWQGLKKLKEEGKFPDGGIYQQTFPEAHVGWNEYAEDWGLSAGYLKEGEELLEDDDQP